MQTVVFFRKMRGITLTVILTVILSYFCIDRQLVWFFHGLNSRQYHWIHVVQQLPELLLILSPFLLVAALIIRKRKADLKLKWFFLSGSLSILLANVVKLFLKYLFGRYWPETFQNNNPSFIHDGAYGFHPFHAGVYYSSFPSGHMATVIAFSTCIWIIYPRLRWVSILISSGVFLALLILYYHFLSDLIAGAYVGMVLSVLVVEKMRHKNVTSDNPIGF